MREFDLRSLLEALNAKGVRFVVIGGVAVGAHGYVRGTEDLDLVPDPDPENLDLLTRALTELESTLPTVADDIVQRARGVPSYSQLIDDAVESDLLGVPVLICSLVRLHEMKAAQNREQDRADLANLPGE
ncbi:MAG TPA: hypothetical protein VFT79_13335 [Solirubrobacterales bacterium]|nr:hypothetical protein [Solirubrobacterales bacterium]